LLGQCLKKGDEKRGEGHSETTKNMDRRGGGEDMERLWEDRVGCTYVW